MSKQPDFYEGGDWNAVCFRCGAKRKASQLWKQWQGYFVCPEHWEPRHPQDFVRSVPDYPGTPWSQPEILNNYIGPPQLAGFPIQDTNGINILDTNGLGINDIGWNT